MASAFIALAITFIIGWKLGDVFTEERLAEKRKKAHKASAIK